MSSSTAATDQSSEVPAQQPPLQTQPSSGAAAQKLALEKKKLKVLKNALKEERAQRGQVEKELQAA